MSPLRFLDKLEDRVRYALSRRPILYSFIGSVAIVLFWRGVWLTADLIPFLTGPVSLILSSAILLTVGLFVSFFIGEQIIISGLKQEKKLTEKTEAEVEEESITLRQIREDIRELSRKMEELKNHERNP